MKKIFFALAIAALVASCSNQDYDLNEFQVVDDNHRVLTVAENAVHFENVASLLKAETQGTTRSLMDINSSIRSLTDATNDTLLFVAEKESGGWTIYSSDTRVPAIVAKSESGSFDFAMQNENAKAWIQTILADMKEIRKLKDNQLNFSRQEIENNRKFWDAVTNPNKFAQELAGKSNLVIKPNPLPRGHWELYKTRTYDEIYEQIDRLTKTDWHQRHPFNKHCPFKTDGSGERAPAGCCPIAVSQMLYYFNTNNGIPESAPSEAYCYSYLDEKPYNWSQYNYNSQVWSQMNIGDCSKSAPLIADIGRRINVIYGNKSTSATSTNTIEYGLNDFGIATYYLDFDAERTVSTLSKQVPVLLFARSYDTNSWETVGHAFITDRYKRERHVVEHTYQWIYDYMPIDQVCPIIDDKVEYTYSNEMTYLGMNWGWGAAYNSPTEWYTSTGDWITPNYNWNINRQMVICYNMIKN